MDRFGLRYGLHLAIGRVKSKPGEPPVLYAWDVFTEDGLGACGVTDDRALARRRVGRELEAAGAGALGKVSRVTLSLSGRVEYVVLATDGRAMRDEATGAVTWVN